jgi:hypothetical protein
MSICFFLGLEIDMLANIRDITTEIEQLLEFNRNVLKRVQMQDLYEMREKLDAILAIKKYMEQIDNIKLTKDLETLADKYSDIIREGAEIAQADSKARADISATENPFSAAARREQEQDRRNPFVQLDKKLEREVETIIQAADTISGSTELMFSNALRRSIAKESVSAPPLSPQSIASTAVSIEPAVQSPQERSGNGLHIQLPYEICDDCGEDRSAKTRETPRTEYRTISLSTSSPRG